MGHGKSLSSRVEAMPELAVVGSELAQSWLGAAAFSACAVKIASRIAIEANYLDLCGEARFPERLGRQLFGLVR